MNEQPSDLSRTLTTALLLATCLTILIISWPYLVSGAPAGADLASHFAEIMDFKKLIQAGSTDFWSDLANMGYPYFITYQPLPMLVMSLTTMVTEGFLDPVLTFKVSLVLLWALMPIIWYRSGRWFGLTRLEALLFGLMSQMISDRTAFGLSWESIYSLGLYTQLYGMAMLPPTLSYLYRLLMMSKGSPWIAAVFFSLLSLSHIFFGMLCGMVSILMVCLRGPAQPWQLRCYLHTVLVALTLMAFWLIPLVLNLDFVGGYPFDAPSLHGFPALLVFSDFMTGAMFDHGRFPWLTPLVAGGFFLALARWAQSLPRFVTMCFVTSFLLYLGRTSFGEFYDLLPFHDSLQVIRYLASINFFGALLASLCLAMLIQKSVDRINSRVNPPAVLATLTTLCCTVLLVCKTMEDRPLLTTFNYTESSFQEVKDIVAAQVSGRLLAHRLIRSGNAVDRNFVPALAGVPTVQSYSRGYHDSLNLYYLDQFNFTPAQFDLYNISHMMVIEPSPIRWLERHFELMVQMGKTKIYRTGDHGYFDFIDTPFTVYGDYKDIRATVGHLLTTAFEKNILPKISNGKPDGVGSYINVTAAHEVHYYRWGNLLSDFKLPESAKAYVKSTWSNPVKVEGRILQETNEPNAYSAVVESKGEQSRLLLKVTYYPYWHATIDGQEAPIDHVAPSFMAVSVPRGQHTVKFIYKNPLYQKLLFLVFLFGLPTCIALAGRAGSKEPSSDTQEAPMAAAA